MRQGKSLSELGKELQRQSVSIVNTLKNLSLNLLSALSFTTQGFFYFLEVFYYG